MVRTSNNIAPFLLKCYEIVNDPLTDPVISWSQSNDTFVIWDATRFSSDLLPKYFKHKNFSSFMRQLNIYGFKKVDTDRWEFANEGFIKDQKDLLKTIIRRKNTQGSSQKSIQDQQMEHPQAAPQTNFQEQQNGASNEVGNTNLHEEVELLKTAKNALMQELTNLKNRQESSQKKLILLRDSVQGMENNQQQLLSFLVMVMQNPGLLVQLLQPKENSWRVAESGKITLDDGSECTNNTASDGLIVRYQSLPEGSPTPSPCTMSESEKPMESDLSFEWVKNFFMNFDLPSPPLDESFPSSDNYGPTARQELDVAKLKQFLLSSPSRDDDEDSELDDQELLESEMEMESILFGTQLDESSLELVTEQMDCLSPGKTT